MIGSVVSCEDGECGELERVLVAPGTDVVTHLVVEPTHRKGKGRLVPIDLVETAVTRAVRLRCTLAQFDELDPAEAEVIRGGIAVDWESQAAEQQVMERYWGSGNPGLEGPERPTTGMRVEQRAVGEDRIPDDAGEISQGQHVHAIDGPIGRVDGVVADAKDHRMTYVLLEEGHLWGRREIAVPVSAVKFVIDDGVHLSLTKEQVASLPPVDLQR
ncbi:MAG: PRC-barrel domain-containing protein [Actinomycetota bacterium]|nr:PRC-barrel domain-containing protein [Actinomycetota bacterium]